jgi:hypothetical protein
MALLVNKKKLSLDEKKLITKELNVIEEVGFIPGLEFPPEPTKIKMFDTDGDIVFIPHNFAKLYFSDKIMELCKEYQRKNIIFTSELREKQISAFNDSMEILLRERSLLLDVPTGFGKTVLSAKISSELKLLTLVILTRTVLIDSWVKTFKTFTNAKIWNVSDDKVIPDAFDVCICMVGQIDKLKEYRFSFGLVVIDEAHLFCTATYARGLIYFSPKYILIQTATPEKHGLEVALHHLVGKDNVVHRDLDVNFTVIKVLTNICPKTENNKLGNIDYSKYTKWLALSEERNKICIDIIKKNVGKKGLIITNLTAHCEIIEELLDKENIIYDTLYGSKKSHIDTYVTIGTVKKIGTGYDQAQKAINYDGVAFDYMILLNTIKQETTLTQVFGRMFRKEYSKIYYFIDNHGISKRHWTENNKWFKTMKKCAIEQMITNEVVYDKDENKKLCVSALFD